MTWFERIIKKDYFIITICLLTILTSLFATYNVGSERLKVIEYYEDIINDKCPNINHDPYYDSENILVLINETNKNNGRNYR